MFELIGGNYGGKIVDLSLISPRKSVIISVGIGEDINFDVEMIKQKKCLIVGIDPTEKSKKFIANKKNQNFIFFPYALVKESFRDKKIKIYKNTNPNYVSESIYEHHHSVSKKDYYFADIIRLSEIFNKYNNISVLKMDIEGSEYDLLNDSKTLFLLEKKKIPQLICEFHHFCSSYKIQDTKKCIENLKKVGYTFWVPKNKQDKYEEMTFVHQDVI